MWRKLLKCELLSNDSLEERKKVGEGRNRKIDFEKSC
jgi:hypothetical protein